MLTKKLKIINKLGLHARASMQLIDRASRYQSNITIRYNDQQIDAKDILNVMSLAVSVGQEIEMSTDGPDEKEAMEDLTKLINNRFGEQE